MPASRKMTSRTNNAALMRQLNEDTRTLPNFPTEVSPPRHAHIPTIPETNDLLFFNLCLVFSVCATAMQYLHLYRTVWWLPHSHAKYAVNFYLIDLHLVGYLVAMETLPFLVAVYKKVRDCNVGRLCFLLSATLLFVMATVWLSGFLYFSYHVYSKTSGIYLTILIYPPITYTIVYYGHVPSRLLEKVKSHWMGGEAAPASVPVSPAPSNQAPPSSPGGSPQPGDRPGIRNLPGNAPPRSMSPSDQDFLPRMHNCTSNPEEVRDETEYLKADFNRRLRDILFSTLFTFFYASLVPLMFVPGSDPDCDICWSTVHYDGLWCGQHVAVTAVTAFLLYAVHYLPPVYVDLMHRCALHLGRWQKEEGRSAHVPYNAWSELQVFPQGALVKHVRGLFRAVGINNAAEPGNAMHSRFFYFFYPPLRIINFLCLVLFVLLIYQFGVLINSHEWYKIISVSLMIFFNFTTLYKILRNRILLGRCYKEETASNNPHPHTD